MIRAAAVLGLLMLLALPRTAGAQSLNNQISFAAISKAPVGSWAEYVMRKEEEQQTVRARYTLVQRDAKKMALELDSATPMGRLLMRLEFAPDGARGWKLKKALTKLGDAAPVDGHLSAQELGTVLSKDDVPGDPVGRETVVVKGGSYQADHFVRKAERWSTDIWVDEKVFPIGLVKLLDAQHASVELIATGRGGRSAF